MATKLKNFSRTWYMKIIAYLIIIIMIGGVLYHIGNQGTTYYFSNLIVESYEKSAGVRNYFYEAANAIIQLDNINPEDFDANNPKYWKNTAKEENINTVLEETEIATDEDKAEDSEIPLTRVFTTLTIEDLEIRESVETELQNFYNVWWNEEGSTHLRISYDKNGNLYYHTLWDVEEALELSYQTFLKEHPDIERIILEGVLLRKENAYFENKQILEKAVKERGLIYDVISIGEKAESKNREKYRNFPMYIYIERGIVRESSHEILENIYPNFSISEGKAVFIGMGEEYYEQERAKWYKEQSEVRRIVTVCGFGGFFVVIALFYLIAVTGKKPNDEKVHLNFIDKVWSEVQIVVVFLLFLVLSIILRETVFQSQVLVDVYYNICIVIMIGIAILEIELLLSQVRRLKARKFLEGFICFRIMKKIFIMGSLLYKRGKLSRRLLITGIVSCMLCATWIGFPWIVALLIWMIYKYVGDFVTICEGVEKIKAGQLNYQIEVKSKDNELEKLAQDINDISKGLEHAVSNELRSERLKAELISNVSHDLKTPLTSIVTYIDLLKQEEIENEVMKDYINVIDAKAKRLTMLTNDLFEAAKASSGDMPVHLEKVDLNALIRQALGEFDEKLKNADLNIRLHLPENPVYVKADGRLTWRVIDNLLGNIVKYSQTGSRVYIETEELAYAGRLLIKNISAEELNIPAEELMERFKRGDEARNSEGSGLGLNIANSLIDLQHGTFKISIDGDLFKAEFELPKYNE